LPLVGAGRDRYIAAMAQKPPSEGRSYQITVVNAPRAGFRDVYHALLRMPWWSAFCLIVVVYLALNMMFAVGYVLVDGVEKLHPGSLADAFYFSVQTMGTIGYGNMYPVSTAANLLVVAESVTGLIVTALATGLVFVRFSQTRARLAFSTVATISPMDGVPTLMIRIGNERANNIFDVRLRLGMVRTTVSREGVTIYRTIDLAPVRDYTPALNRSFTVLHRIEPGSPLHGDTPESFARDDVEIMIAVTGTDDTSLTPVHARRTFEHTAIRWGARHADILTELPTGDLILDLSRFQAVVETEPTEGFPYPRRKSTDASPPM
jgi:inward rectifier potassium channel